MIISASRRTDIPAFYAEWMVNRLRAGFCLVANPFNPAQVSRVSLAVPDVDAIVFWTKNVSPFFPALNTIDRMGYRYTFLYTINDYPTELEPHVPPLEDRIETFCALSDRLGGCRVTWRYDPIILSRKMDVRFHLAAFRRIAGALQERTDRVIISFLDFYRKTERRLSRIEESVRDSFLRDPTRAPRFGELVAGLSEIAQEHGMSVQSCAELPQVAAHGIPPGACIAGAHLRDVFGLDLAARKDPGQRDACLCTRSRDIGATDTCLHGCAYCYSTRSQAAAEARHAEHDPSAPALLGVDLCK